jgi:hypothetical protein
MVGVEEEKWRMKKPDPAGNGSGGKVTSGMNAWLRSWMENDGVLMFLQLFGPGAAYLGAILWVNWR